MPAAKQSIASKIVHNVSEVNPLRFVISSDNMLVRIPGALSFESNHETYLKINALNKRFLTSKVKFSPEQLKKNL